MASFEFVTSIAVLTALVTVAAAAAAAAAAFLDFLLGRCVVDEVEDADDDVEHDDLASEFLVFLVPLPLTLDANRLLLLDVLELSQSSSCVDGETDEVAFTTAELTALISPPNSGGVLELG